MNSTPFVIKYRPKTLEDFIGDEMLMTTLRGFVEKKFIPNICIYGSNGVGKTCIIECLIKKLYHPNNRGAIIEFSTCDDRGIKIMEQLDFFNKKKITFEEGYMEQKLIIFDNADNLSENVQQLINLSMCKYKNTSIILICNNSTGILESLQSRCIKLFFSNIPDCEIIKKVKMICLNENIQIHNDEAILYIFNMLKRDIRATYNLLELFTMNQKKINISNTNKLLGIPSQQIFNKLEQHIVEKNVSQACSIIHFFDIKGYYALDILFYFINYIVYLSKIEEEKKIKMLELYGNHAYLMSKTTNNYIQLMSVIFQSIEIL